MLRPGRVVGHPPTRHAKEAQQGFAGSDLGGMFLSHFCSWTKDILKSEAGFEWPIATNLESVIANMT